MKAKDFIDDAKNHKKYFNIKIDGISAERSVKCKAGDLRFMYSFIKIS